ncbi:radical SAM protein [Dissulfurirhabdus thermomarina]|uniref:Radical SAM protein n=1 Tax=Dissulfurirhabdus thermomarina TaxID=1765737 RepID=A0A6N9TKE2_DISTH|nr:radical SAM protein [Dissulfurirhabdus thermomarina]NDY41569.1 radical SAM protein [Dissulfurirhabdus thermomarina]NMX22376.1 radical SAM protein [Dissulfurirhabdus thermomarina]
MKILLAYPPFSEERIRDEDVRAVPIGLYYVGARLLERGHRVRLANWHDVHRRPGEVARTLAEFRPDVLGLSLFNANRWGALAVAREAKRLDPSVRVVFGGVGATFLWRHFLAHFPEVDYVVIGEGEETMADLAAHLEAGGGAAPAAVPGLAFRGPEGPVRTAERPFIEDLDTLPDPARRFTFQHVVSSRGCPWNCRFCGSPRFWKRRVRFHSPDYFVGQIETLARKGVTYFFVSDDTFTLRKDRVIEICRRIADARLPVAWQAISRVNCVDGEVLYWMRRAGCRQISYGVESGSPRIRAFFEKRFTDDEVRRAFDLTRRFGILPRAYFIYGAPGESRKTIDASIRLMREIRPLALAAYVLDIYPGTRLYEEYKRRHRVSDDVWLSPAEDLLYFETDPALDGEKVHRLGRRLKRAFHEGLPEFAESLELEDRPELRPLHADFLSRLAMTFSHGEYARVGDIPRKAETAEVLFRRALEWHPLPAAYLGLGVLRQKARDFPGSIEVLEAGLARFPDDEQLHLCLAVSLMNTGDFAGALAHLERFPDSEAARRYLPVCRANL